MYQLGFDFQATPPTFALKRSGTGTHWVGQTSFFSCSDKSPATDLGPVGAATKLGLPARMLDSKITRFKINKYQFKVPRAS